MHVLIVGTTMSGKTTLAKKLAQKARNNGRGVLVFDPIRDPTWPADFVTDDPVLFMQTARKNRNCHLFIDEAGEICNQYERENFWYATQARHFGHVTCFMSQRANMVAKSIRDNCSKLFAFRVSPSDAKILADDFCFPQLIEAPQLAQGEFLYCPRYGDVLRMNVFENNA